MTIGPAPMIRIDEMSVRLGILLFHHRAFPAVVVAVEFITPCLHLLRLCLEARCIDGYRRFKHEAILRGSWTNLVASADRYAAKLVDATTVEIEQGMAGYLTIVAVLRQYSANLG